MIRMRRSLIQPADRLEYSYVLGPALWRDRLRTSRVICGISTSETTVDSVMKRNPKRNYIYRQPHELLLRNHYATTIPDRPSNSVSRYHYPV
jgi:hypothetical protein